MKVSNAAAVAIIAGVALAPTAAAQPRPIICQLLDQGINGSAIRAMLATQDGAPWGGQTYPGEYVATYYTTLSLACPEYCNGIEC